MTRTATPLRHPGLILASASPRRRELLAQIGVAISAVVPADIDETEKPSERPLDLVRRLAQEKARVVHQAKGKDAFVLAGDTIVVMGKRILGKPADAKEAANMLRALSGRKHKVISGVAVIAPDGRLAVRAVTTHIKFKRLHDSEIAHYIQSNEWQGKAGAYGIQGLASIFVADMKGSYSNVVGLPLYETATLLTGLGFAIPNTGAPA